MFDEDLDQALEDQIDLTPLIDAMFLLLIFFIMATTFSKPVLDVMLPHAESSTNQTSHREQMLITIDHQGHIFHEGRECPVDELPGLMDLHPELPLNFHVDQRAPFKSFVSALDQARIKRRSEIVITTEPADSLRD